MRKRIGVIAIAFGCVTLAIASGSAQQTDHMSAHMAPKAPDARKMLDFPPLMREHMLANMRGHLEALSEILTALSTGDAGKAGAIADTRLGLASAGAAACKPENSARTSQTGGMAAMMAQHMPEEMRAMGYAMHEAASNFAAEAAKTPAGGDLKPALAALSQVAQNCAACHTAYRLQ